MTYLDVGSPSADSQPIKGKDAKQPSARLRKYWREIEAYNKTSSDWREQAEKIVKLYLDQHRTYASTRRFALLWSNVETLKPAIYAKIPTVVCSRRYKDSHPVGRIACEILERATNTTFDLYHVDEVFRMVRDDRLLSARGQGWVRFEASFEKSQDEQGQDYDKLVGQKVCVDYVHWADFGHNVAGVWKDVWLVWRRVYKTRDEIKERFDEKLAERLTYSARVDSDGKEESGEYVACLYELWDKKRKQTVFISKDYPEIIEEGTPPLDFRDFFPCPEPCYGSKTSKSLIPTPDYRYYQDQANEIDDLTEKIANLTEYLMLRGFIPAGPSADGADAVRILIQQMQDGIIKNKNVLIPVESWAGFTEKGGSAKLIDWLPIDKVIQALKGAIEARNQLIQDVYQISGIADILRGQTDPDETLGAQQLKAQTGQRRLKNAKDELARFCRDIAQLVAEVIAEQFEPQTLAEMTGFAYQPMSAPMPQMPMPQPGGAPMPQVPGGQPPGAPMPQVPGQPPQQSPSGQTFDDQVLQLLRNDKMRGFLIDIETDSTIQPDEDAEKQRRTEFITAVGTFMKEAALVLPGAPALSPMVSEMLLFLVRGYRAGRNLEEVIERSMQQLQGQLAQPKPDPKMAEFQAKTQADEKRLAMEQQNSAAELQFKQAESQQKLAFEAQKHEQQITFEREKHQNDMMMRSQEMQAKVQEGELARQMQIDQHAQSMDMEREKMTLMAKEGEHERTLKRDVHNAPTENQRQQLNDLVSEIVQHVGKLSQAVDHAIEKVDSIHSDMTAPTEIIRGRDGRPAQIKRGNRVMNVQHDAQGRMARIH